MLTLKFYAEGKRGNRLVNAKSERMKHGDELLAQIIKGQQGDEALRMGHVDALKAVISTSLELDRISPKTINPLPRFNRPEDTEWNYVPVEYPNEVIRIISECKANLRKAGKPPEKNNS